MRKKIKRWKLICLAIIISWLLVAQSCMKFRISDSDAKERFAHSDITLTTADFTANNFTLHYAKTGNDSLPTLFFIHGSPGAWSAFERFMRDKDLLSKYRMIAVDRPGFGYSQFGDAMNLEDQVAIITPFIQSLRNAKPIYGIGHSLGGPLVAKLQMDTPGLFSGLVFLAASVDPAEEKKEQWRYVLDKTPLLYLVPGAFKPSNRELIYLKDDLTAMNNRWNSITCPVWIVHGNKDTFVPVGNASYLDKKLTAVSSKSLLILDGARHFIPWEQYDEIKNVLMELK
ncbi:MAG: alpha/beta fold hydrolase [Agriterribacter sp.]